jgi:hypothetical protein
LGGERARSVAVIHTNAESVLSMRLLQKAVDFDHPVDGGFGPASLLDDGIDFLSKCNCMLRLGSQII